MTLTSDLPQSDRERVETRLRSNLIAVYTRPEKQKLRNLAANPRVSFVLDVTDVGRNIVRLEGSAVTADDQPPANEYPAYLAKYTERIAALFGTPEQFATLFSTPLIITPAKLHT
jgi:PPOX class probable F420-dependent enzyme